MQIGAYDGVGDDDLGGLIKQHRLRGVLVEPQPAAFARLQKTYASQRQIVLLQAAIAEEQGLREFYGRQSRPTMAASFDREHLLRHGIPEDDIVTMCVECQTVESALRAAGLKILTFCRSTPRATTGRSCGRSTLHVCGRELSASSIATCRRATPTPALSGGRPRLSILA